MKVVKRLTLTFWENTHQNESNDSFWIQLKHQESRKKHLQSILRNYEQFFQLLSSLWSRSLPSPSSWADVYSRPREKTERIWGLEWLKVEGISWANEWGWQNTEKWMRGRHKLLSLSAFSFCKYAALGFFSIRKRFNSKSLSMTGVTILSFSQIVPGLSQIVTYCSIQ